MSGMNGHSEETRVTPCWPFARFRWSGLGTRLRRRRTPNSNVAAAAPVAHTRPAPAANARERVADDGLRNAALLERAVSPSCIGGGDSGPGGTPGGITSAQEQQLLTFVSLSQLAISPTPAPAAQRTDCERTKQRQQAGSFELRRVTYNQVPPVHCSELSCVRSVCHISIEPIPTSNKAHISPLPSPIMQPVNILHTQLNTTQPKPNPNYQRYAPPSPPASQPAQPTMYVMERRVPLPVGYGAEIREPEKLQPEDAIVRAASPVSINFMSQPRRSHGIHTFVMMPLDFGQPNGWLSNNDKLHSVLGTLRNTGIHGVMVDVWWGLCEREPQNYDFGSYLWLADACRHHGLRLQAVMAFHACGGNVGDNVNVPLPRWASEAADKHGAWYLERAQKDGARHHEYNREYISLGADHCVFLPGIEGLRTPIEAYSHFVEAFCRTMSEKGFAGSTVTEVQVGMGPCGEARYPSYPLRDGKWRFPGVGELQCFDKYLLSSLAAAAKRDGHPVEWGVPPADTGFYNNRVKEVPFYNGPHRSEHGRFFLKWYSEALVQHVEDVLTGVTSAVRAVNMEVAVKVAGIHWGYLTAARAPECNAGYLVNEDFSFYDAVAAVLRRHGAVLDFTCLEMASEHQPEGSNAAPRQLVHDVLEAAARAGVPVAGENALECYDRDSYNRVVDSFKWSRAEAHGFTLLRMTRTLLEHDNLHNLRRLGEKLRNVN